jgi:hypothetical protein
MSVDVDVAVDIKGVVVVVGGLDGSHIRSKLLAGVFSGSLTLLRSACFIGLLSLGCRIAGEQEESEA